MQVFILDFRRLAHVFERGGLVDFFSDIISRLLPSQCAMDVSASADALICVDTIISNNTRCNVYQTCFDRLMTRVVQLQKMG